MAITAKPISRSVTAWTASEGVLPLEWDSAEYECQPRSVTVPLLAKGEGAAGKFVAFVNGIDFDYMVESGSYDGETFVAAVAMPEGGSYEDMVVLLLNPDPASWTHVHADLTPGRWVFQFGVQRGSACDDPIQAWFDNIELSPSLHLEPQIDKSNLIPTVELTLTAEEPYFTVGHRIPAGVLTLFGPAPSGGTPYSLMTTRAMVLTKRNPSYVWTIPRNNRDKAQVIYYCILTGAENGVADVYLPISSFQARMRDGEPSYLSCVVPSSLLYADLVEERSEGEIIIRKGYRFDDGSEQTEEIIRVDYEYLQIDRGSQSDSLTITGHKTITSTAPKDWTVQGVSFFGVNTDGKRRIRADIDLFLRCGDVCIYGIGASDYFIVGLISYSVQAAGYVSMEVGEA